MFIGKLGTFSTGEFFTHMSSVRLLYLIHMKASTRRSIDFQSSKKPLMTISLQVWSHPCLGQSKPLLSNTYSLKLLCAGLEPGCGHYNFFFTKIGSVIKLSLVPDVCLIDSSILLQSSKFVFDAFEPLTNLGRI